MIRFANFALAAVVLVTAGITSPAFAQAAPANVDAQADKVLRSMTTYVAGLKQFSAQTENSLEVVTKDGQKIQFIAPASLIVSRPNKLFASRKGDIIDQRFYYDGKWLTLYNPDTKYYSTVAAPATVDDAIDFARSTLDVLAPGADLIDTRAYERLMQNTLAGTYVGISVVAGQRCHHLAYRGKDVDWQIWVREGSQPIPCRYVITTKGVDAGPQFSLQIVNWNSAPKIPAGTFSFVPPAGAKAIEFLPVSAAPNK